MSILGISGPVGDRNQDPAAQSTAEQSPAGTGEQSTPRPELDPKRRSGRAQASARPQPSTTRNRRKRPKHSTHLPSRLQILATLAKLTPLIATGLIQPAQANAMRANLVALLDELRHDSQATGSTGGDVSKLNAVLRQNPDLLDALSHLLSDDELGRLVDDDIGQAEGECEEDDASENPAEHASPAG